MQQSDIDQIERWVSEGDIGAIDAKLTTVAARDYIEYRAALLNGRDQILQARAAKQQREDHAVAKRAERIAIAAVIVSLLSVGAQLLASVRIAVPP